MAFFVQYFCPPLNPSLKISPFLCIFFYMALLMWDAFSCCVYCWWTLFAHLKPCHKHDETKTNNRQLSTCSIYSVCWEGRGNEFKEHTIKISTTCSCLMHPICPVSQNCFIVDILSGLQKLWYKTTHISLYIFFYSSHLTPSLT